MAKAAPIISLDGRCTATSKQSKQRCRNDAIPGGNVCRFHGVNENVRERAAERLSALVDLALDRITLNIIWADPAVAQKAAETVLDRLGIKSDTIGEILVRMMADRAAGEAVSEDDPEFDALVSETNAAKLQRYLDRTTTVGSDEVDARPADTG